MVLAQAIGLLIFGFVILIKGADFLVDGASAVAKKFNISDMVIGLTIVSFGTSAPELVVNIDAAIRGENALIIGSILGSNIFNTCLILGAAGLIYPMMVQKATVFKEFPFSVLIIFLMFFLANDALIWGGNNVVSHIDGFIFLGLFLGFLFNLFISFHTAGFISFNDFLPPHLPILLFFNCLAYASLATVFALSYCDMLPII